MYQAISASSLDNRLQVRIFVLAFLLASLAFAKPATAADAAGVLKFARGDVTIESSSGEKRKAAKGDDLELGDLVVTGAASLAVIQLKDDSRLTLRPYTAFRVNRLQMDSGKDSSGQQSAVLNLLRGGLRLLTGLIGRANPAGYRLTTPVATIGIRGTEFNTRLCSTDCAAEEERLAGGDAAANISEGLYVIVDDGRVFLENFAGGEPLELQQGESGYVADLNSLPVKLSLVPAFQLLDKIPSPSQLDFDDIEIPDDALQADESALEEAEVETASVSEAPVAARNIAGDYELDDISYGSDLPIADRKWFFGANPDLEFTLTQQGDRFEGEFEGDRDGTIKGRINGDEVTFEFVLEARGGEYKDGAGTWIIQDNGDLKGDFNIRDQQRGVVRGRWVLEKD